LSNEADYSKKGAFYGGTALRIFYGVPRFSEDLDFSLITPSSDFSQEPYINGIKTELEAFGFSVHAESRNKKIKSFLWNLQETLRRCR